MAWQLFWGLCGTRGVSPHTFRFPDVFNDLSASFLKNGMQYCHVLYIYLFL